jgi:hypothetical protein
VHVTTETPIRAPFVDEEPRVLRLELGACRLRVTPGAGEPWVEGTYSDPTDDLAPRLDVDRGRVTLRQERSFTGTVGLLRGSPTCELRLGTDRPFRLELDTGASEVDLDLSGVRLQGLQVRAGAGKLRIAVHRPNPVEMDELSVRMGAGALDATGLGNLAAARLRAETGAASVTMDLGGELRRHLEARISAGMSGIRLTVPEDRPVRVTSETTLGATDLGDGFVTRAGAMHTVPEGDPIIDLHATVALGSLQLRTGPSAAPGAR